MCRLNALIMSRFILNLRTIASRTDDMGSPFSDRDTPTGTLLPSGGIGSIGASIRFAGDSDGEEEDSS